eukprot:5300880-Prymnesium_polylepis.1
MGHPAAATRARGSDALAALCACTCGLSVIQSVSSCFETCGAVRGAAQDTPTGERFAAACSAVVRATGGAEPCKSTTAQLLVCGRKTPVTPSIWKIFFASGEICASRKFRKSRAPVSSTCFPGRNLRLSGLGVGSVWMNIDRMLWAGRNLRTSARAQRRGAVARARAHRRPWHPLPRTCSTGGGGQSQHDKRV